MRGFSLQDGEAMLPEHSRPWQVIAKELSIETNSKRIFELAGELTNALDEKGHHTNPPIERNPAEPFPVKPAHKP
jgi:hypothetical protein